MIKLTEAEITRQTLEQFEDGQISHINRSSPDSDLLSRRQIERIKLEAGMLTINYSHCAQTYESDPNNWKTDEHRAADRLVLKEFEISEILPKEGQHRGRLRLYSHKTRDYFLFLRKDDSGFIPLSRALVSKPQAMALT